jgi:hypothetical protein
MFHQYANRHVAVACRNSRLKSLACITRHTKSGGPKPTRGPLSAFNYSPMAVSMAAYSAVAQRRGDGRTMPSPVRGLPGKGPSRQGRRIQAVIHDHGRFTMPRGFASSLPLELTDEDHPERPRDLDR